MRGKPDVDESFDPTTHQMSESHYYEDVKVGDTFPIPSRTLGEANFAAFQLASGDNHPIHYDIEYCRRHGHPNLLAHGYQIAIQAAPGAGDFPFIVGEAMMPSFGVLGIGGIVAFVAGSVMLMDDRK